jgi:hypothetical protein
MWLSIFKINEIYTGEFMGWWNNPENKDLTIGDTVLDLTRHFLNDFSQEYKEDLGRKPTLGELEYVLSLAFKVNIDQEILSDFEEQEIKQVTLKAAKRPKRQKAKPGDIVSFKLDDGRYGFCRIVSMVSIGSVVEIFDYFSDQPVFDYSKLEKWIIPPVTIDTYSLLDTRADGDWRIIGSTPGFSPGDKFRSIRFVYGTTPNTLMAVDIFDKEEPISAENAKDLPRYSSRGDFDVKELLKDTVGRSNN